VFFCPRAALQTLSSPSLPPCNSFPHGRTRSIPQALFFFFLLFNAVREYCFPPLLIWSFLTGLWAMLFLTLFWVHDILFFKIPTVFAGPLYGDRDVSNFCAARRAVRKVVIAVRWFSFL